jgi:phosphohistidine phosphatase
MKTLTLLRHAKSGWDDPVARDFDRPLNLRGRAGALVMGHYLKRERMVFDYVISSPAARCTETLDGLWESYGQTLHPNWDRRIYLASAATLLDVVQDLPESASSVLMCGHNPGMEDLALSLVPDTPDNMLRDILDEKFPTGSIAEIAWPEQRWSAIRSASARLLRFVRPRDLDPRLAPGTDTNVH